MNGWGQEQPGGAANQGYVIEVKDTLATGTAKTPKAKLPGRAPDGAPPRKKISPPKYSRMPGGAPAAPAAASAQRSAGSSNRLPSNLRQGQQMQGNKPGGGYGMSLVPAGGGSPPKQYSPGKYVKVAAESVFDDVLFGSHKGVVPQEPIVSKPMQGKGRAAAQFRVSPSKKLVAREILKPSPPRQGKNAQAGQQHQRAAPPPRYDDYGGGGVDDILESTAGYQQYPRAAAAAPPSYDGGMLGAGGGYAPPPHQQLYPQAPSYPQHPAHSNYPPGGFQAHPGDAFAPLRYSNALQYDPLMPPRPPPQPQQYVQNAGWGPAHHHHHDHHHHHQEQQQQVPPPALSSMYAPEQQWNPPFTLQQPQAPPAVRVSKSEALAIAMEGNGQSFINAGLGREGGGSPLKRGAEYGARGGHHDSSPAYDPQNQQQHHASPPNAAPHRQDYHASPPRHEHYAPMPASQQQQHQHSPPQGDGAWGGNNGWPEPRDASVSPGKIVTSITRGEYMVEEDRKKALEKESLRKSWEEQIRVKEEKKRIEKERQRQWESDEERRVQSIVQEHGGVPLGAITRNGIWLGRAGGTELRGPATPFQKKRGEREARKDIPDELISRESILQSYSLNPDAPRTSHASVRPKHADPEPSASGGEGEMGAGEGEGDMRGEEEEYFDEEMPPASPPARYGGGGGGGGMPHTPSSALVPPRTGGASRQSGRRLVSFADEEAPPSSRGEMSRGGLSRGGASRGGLAPYSPDRYNDDGYGAAAAADTSMGDTQYYLGKYGGGVGGGGGGGGGAGGGGGGRMVDPRSMEMKAKMGELEQEIIRQKQQIQNLLPSAYGDAGGAGGAGGYVPSRQSGVPPPVVKAPTRFAKVPRVAQEGGGGGGGGGGRGGGGGGAGGGRGGRKGTIYRGEKELGGAGGDGRIISTSSRLIYYSGPPQPDANS